MEALQWQVAGSESMAWVQKSPRHEAQEYRRARASSEGCLQSVNAGKSIFARQATRQDLLRLVFEEVARAAWVDSDSV